jgi:hypothetical protein
VSEGPFTWEWVRENVVHFREEAIELDRAACERIAAEFNRAYVEVNFPPVWDSPHTLHAAFHYPVQGGTHDPVRSTAVVGDGKNGRLWRWYGPVLSMGEVVRKELVAANPNRKPPFGYTPDGLIVQILLAAILLITEEHPPAGAVAKELERQRKLRSD